MTELITEQEFFDVCSLYVSENRTEHPPEENEKRIYLLIAVSETDENVGTTAHLIDPSLSNEMRDVRKNFHMLTWGQQIMLGAIPGLQKITSESVDQIGAFHNKARELGISEKELFDIIANSSSGEETKKKIRKLRK